MSELGEMLLAHELREMGNRLLMLAEMQEAGTDRPRTTPGTSDYVLERTNEGDLRNLARAEYAARRSRVRFLPAGLFGEAAWDIMLDLFIANLGGSRVSLKAACIASALPETTAYRWIDVLIAMDLAQKSPDLADKRRCWLELTATGDAALRGYFQRLVKLGRRE